MIDTPSSLETSSYQSNRDAPGTPQAQPSSSQEPRKCWICFSDETEDTPTSSEWISPCPCALQAHQTCLLDWIADLESPKRKKAKKIRCPQCKSHIKVLQPHSLSIEIVRAISRITGRLVWPAAGCAVGTMVTAGLFMHGAHTASILMDRHEYQRFMFPRSGRLPLSRALGIPLIPILLILSRTSAGDSILPFLPLLYITSSKVQFQGGLAVRGTPDLWICSLPVLRSVYFAAYRKWALPRERAWLQEIEPRAADNAEENGAQEQENAEGGGGGPLDMDFELGVQIEVDAIDDGIGHHHLHHIHDHDLQPNIQHQEAVNPAPPNNNRDADNQNGNPQNGPRAQPQRPRPIIQNFVFAIPDLVRVSLGALALPLVSYYMGQLIKATLPKSWVASPTWNRSSKGILQSQTGRTVVGGCLFIVLKDSLFLYSKYSMAQNHKKRKVLNYSEIRKPWWKKNVDELMERRGG